MVFHYGQVNSAFLILDLEKFGFVDFPRFAVQDSDGEWFRCDLLIKAHLEQIKANKDEKDDVKARCDEVVGKKHAFNLNYINSKI